MLGTRGKIFNVVFLLHNYSFAVAPLLNSESTNSLGGCFCVWHPEGPRAQRESVRSVGNVGGNN